MKQNKKLEQLSLNGLTLDKDKSAVLGEALRKNKALRTMAVTGC